jgi:uncharacterized protein (TIGR03435 family)
MDRFANAISSLSASEVSRTVVNRTALPGEFDLTIDLTPEKHDSSAISLDRQEGQFRMPNTTFLEALHEQLGLKLESTRANIPVLVVDHVERPGQN